MSPLLVAPCRELTSCTSLPVVTQPGARSVFAELHAAYEKVLTEVETEAGSGVGAARLAVLDSAAQAAARLVGKVVECVHRALEADVQLVDIAFRQGDGS